MIIIRDGKKLTFLVRMVKHTRLQKGGEPLDQIILVTIAFAIPQMVDIVYLDEYDLKKPYFAQLKYHFLGSKMNFLPFSCNFLS